MSLPMSSVRYQALLQIMEKAMTRTRTQIDVKNIVKDLYGDDLVMFGPNALEDLVYSMLDRMQDETLEGMKGFLEKKNVQELLLKVELLVREMDEQVERQKKEDELDKETSHRASRDASLPKDIKPEDLIDLKAYETMKTERDTLLAEIAEIERETQQLEAQRVELSNSTSLTLQNVEKVGTELEKAADVCSMVS